MWSPCSPAPTPLLLVFGRLLCRCHICGQAAPDLKTMQVSPVIAVFPCNY